MKYLILFLILMDGITLSGQTEEPIKWYNVNEVKGSHGTSIKDTSNPSTNGLVRTSLEKALFLCYFPDNNPASIRKKNIRTKSQIFLGMGTKEGIVFADEHFNNVDKNKKSSSNEMSKNRVECERYSDQKKFSLSNVTKANEIFYSGRCETASAIEYSSIKHTSDYYIIVSIMDSIEYNIAFDTIGQDRTELTKDKNYGYGGIVLKPIVLEGLIKFEIHGYVETGSGRLKLFKQTNKPDKTDTPKADKNSNKTQTQAVPAKNTKP